MVGLAGETFRNTGDIRDYVGREREKKMIGTQRGTRFSGVRVIENLANHVDLTL